MIFNEKVLDNQGCKIHYWISNNSSEECIVFLHGAGLDHHMFSEQIKAIPEKYKILMWDARGHGRSRPIGNDFSISLLVQDLLIILKNEKCNNTILIGQSMGGNVAQEIAFYHPEIVTKLILIDCARNTNMLSNMEKFSLSIAPLLFYVYPWKSLVKQSAMASSLNNDVQLYIIDCFNTIGKEDFCKIIIETTKCLHYEEGYSINKPILMLCGEKDRTGNIKKIMPIWAKQENKCNFYMIENASHNSNQDNPELVNRYISSFLFEK
ncbi:MAG: alpha/beta hydrolase [Spirochaetales bacterium]|nr:alpha/beta hydrolase [Spirochaetales bacterium]